MDLRSLLTAMLLLLLLLLLLGCCWLSVELRGFTGWGLWREKDHVFTRLYNQETKQKILSQISQKSVAHCACCKEKVQLITEWTQDKVKDRLYDNVGKERGKARLSHPWRDWCSQPSWVTNCLFLIILLQCICEMTQITIEGCSVLNTD